VFQPDLVVRDSSSNQPAPTEKHRGEAEDAAGGVRPGGDAHATHAEATGLDSLWVCDHSCRAGGQAPGAIHEGWTIVAAPCIDQDRAGPARYECPQRVAAEL
jgi:hypothetical protein